MRYRRILVTGASGQIGWELERRLATLGETIAVDLPVLDLADPASIARTVRDVRPDLVVNAAAYTAVDKAEREPALAHAINATGPGVLADEAGRQGAVFIHYSTDYVFDGTATVPYAEDSPTAPINVYGESKLAGERAVSAAGGTWVTLRTSWVYGLRGGNFLLTMRRLAAERDEIRVVADQVGTPNWCGALAAATVAVVDRPREELDGNAGIYHLTSTGRTSWYGFAQAILKDHPRVKVVPITTDQYPTPARRPRFSVLDGARLAAAFGVVLPSWEEGLRQCLARDGGWPARCRREPSPGR